MIRYPRESCDRKCADILLAEVGEPGVPELVQRLAAGVLLEQLGRPQADGMYWQVDLGSPRTFDELEMQAPVAHRRPDHRHPQRSVVDRRAERLPRHRANRHRRLRSAQVSRPLGTKLYRSDIASHHGEASASTCSLPAAARACSSPEQRPGRVPRSRQRGRASARRHFPGVPRIPGGRGGELGGGSAVNGPFRPCVRRTGRWQTSRSEARASGRAAVRQQTSRAACPPWRGRCASQMTFISRPATASRILV
jgi:hypothetical protein